MKQSHDVVISQRRRCSGLSGGGWSKMALIRYTLLSSSIATVLQLQRYCVPHATMLSHARNRQGLDQQPVARLDELVKRTSSYADLRVAPSRAIQRASSMGKNTDAGALRYDVAATRGLMYPLPGR